MEPIDFLNNPAIWIVAIVLILLFTLVTLLITWFVIRWIRNAYGSGGVKGGMTAPATITRVWDTGTTINENPLVGMELQVNPPGGTPFSAQCKQMVSRLQVGYFQPGLPVTVSYDPANPKKMHITEASAPAAGAAAGAVARPTEAQVNPAAIQQQLQAIDAANQVLMATGVSASATVTGYTDWNVLVNGENPAVTLTLEVRPPGKPPFMAQASGVIAAASVPKYQPGRTIYVKYDPNNLTRVTIDHS